MSVQPSRFAAAALLGWALTQICVGEVVLSQVPVEVIAKLGEQSITNRDVDFQLGRVASETSEPLIALPPAILQSTIQLVAQQRQALQTMRTRNLAVRRDDVERWMEENGQPGNGETLSAEALIRKQSRQAGISESNLRDHLAFRLSWQRYLQQQLNEKNVAKHFENQTKRFDGTRFRVSLVNIAVSAGKSPKRERLAQGLADLHGRLMSAELPWKGVADELMKLEPIDAKDSVRVREQIWCRGTGDLDPTLVTTLMKMMPEEVSEPIHTATGVHLIKLHKVEAGSKALADVRDEVRVHMLIHLLEHLARQSESQLPLQAIE